MTRSGMKEASAPNTMSHTRCEISWLAYTTGAGYVAFTTVPSGASTSTGRQAPELGGTTPAESIAVLSAANTPDAVTESGAFIGPGTWGSEPVKSTVRRSPRLTTRSRMSNVSSRFAPGARMPSPSQKSSNHPSPSGRIAQEPPHHRLGVVHDLLHDACEVLRPVLACKDREPVAGPPVGRNLGAKVPAALGRGAHVREDDVLHVAIHHPGALDADGRQAEPLAVDLRHRSVAAGGRAADVGPVRAHRSRIRAECRRRRRRRG